MEKFKNYEYLNSPLMSSEEINFILLEPSLGEISSSQTKSNVRAEMMNILQKDATRVLLLPFNKPEYR